MPQTVQVGSILIKESPLTAELLGLKLEDLEIVPYSGNWNLVTTLDGFAPGSQDSRRGMELLFHGRGSKGHAFRRSRGEENRESIASDLREGETATPQCPRDHWNCPKAFSQCALSANTSL